MPRGQTDATKELVAVAHGILAATHPATVRGVCYQLFNRKLIPDMGKNATARVSRVLTGARERGEIPFSWIVDETRLVDRVSQWDDPADYVDTVRDSYRKDRWADQPNRLMVISEKGTVGGVLRPVLHTYGVPFVVYHGFGSASALWELAGESRRDKRPLTLLYVGDHDPSGRAMSDSDVPGRLERYGGTAKVVRLAVTPAQIRGQGLATFSAHEKKTDARYKWFLDRYGETCCELDAMSANTLRATVDGAINRRLDKVAWARAEAVERVELESLSSFLSSWPTHGSISGLDAQ
jgi:hypothetical protein